MSAFARKQLEKWGWKEGDGLGRDGTGMNSYIKTSRHNRATHNRDEKGNTYAGIGHESTRGAGAGFSERNNELESVFAQMTQQRKEKKKAEASSSSSSDSDNEEDKQKQLLQQQQQKKAGKNHDDSRRRERQEKEEGEKEEVVKPVETKTKQEKQPKRSSSRSQSKSPKLQPTPAPSTHSNNSKKKKIESSSSSSSSDDDDANPKADLTKMSDAELFARCGGVRLGRAGRHRLFDNKLKRIEEHNKTMSEGEDPYAKARQNSDKKKLY